MDEVHCLCYQVFNLDLLQNDDDRTSNVLQMTVLPAILTINILEFLKQLLFE